MPKATYDRAIDRKPGAGGSTTIISSGAASAIVHSTLLGLLVDDHTQYLKADGTRPLTGSLSIADAMTIDGVDISAHAANPDAHHATATEGDGIDIAGQVIAVDSSVVRTSRNLTAGAGLTGGGTLAADRTFAVGAGVGITVNADDVALASSVAGAGLAYSVGVLSVGVANTGATGLTVEADQVRLTSSSAPGAAASILASDATGLLTLPLFVATTSIVSPLVTATTSVTTPIVTAVTNLQLSPSVDLQLYPTGDILIEDGTTLRTDSFSTLYPIEGMIIAETAVAGQYGMAIGVIEADELRVRVFVADEVRIDRGEEIWSKSYGITAADFTTPGSIGGTVTVTFESSPMIAGALFTANDWLLFRTIDIDTGDVLSAVWGQVTGYSASNVVQFWDMMLPDSAMPLNSFPKVDLGTTTQDWTFTLRSGDTSYRIPEGSLGIDYGQAGQSYIAFSVTDPVAAPYIRIRRWTGANPYSPANHDDTVYMGNLNGIANASGDRGIWTQNEAGTAWAELSDDGVILRNASIALYDGAVQKVNIGSSGTDFWMGTSSADKRLSWNGTSLSIQNHDLQTSSDAVFFESFESADALTFWTNYTGSGEISIVSGAGSAGGKALQIGNNSGNDMAWLIGTKLIPFDSGKTYRMRVRAKRSSGSGLVYFGFAGVAADGTTLVNVDGVNTYSSQHYHAAAGGNPATTWTEYTGYTKGFGATVGTAAVGTASTPGKMHPNVRYLRPLILVNYDSVAGQTSIDMVSVEAISAAWHNIDSLPARFGEAPSTTGLYLTATHLGYYDASGTPAWKCWIASTGEFYFGGSSGAHLEWNGSKLRGLNSSSVEQWYADSTTGKLYAGAGAVVLDSVGMTAGNTIIDGNGIRFDNDYAGGTYDLAWEYGGDNHGYIRGSYDLSDWLGLEIYSDTDILVTGDTYFYSTLRVKNSGSGALVGLTSVSNLTGNSTGVGSIKFKGATSRDSAGFVKVDVNGTDYYVPVFSAITG